MGLRVPFDPSVKLDIAPFATTLTHSVSTYQWELLLENPTPVQPVSNRYTRWLNPRLNKPIHFELPVFYPFHSARRLARGHVHACPRTVMDGAIKGLDFWFRHKCNACLVEVAFTQS